MRPIHVLMATRVTDEQLARMRASHSRVTIHGEAGGIAIMDASEVDYKGIDYPEERPDIDVASLLNQAEVIIATRIPAALGERAPNLKWLQFTSAEVDHLWKPFLDSGRVTVTSSKGIHAVPMAEFVMACVLASAKDIPRMIRQQAAHVYQKFVVRELHGATMALIGVGVIGSAIAAQAKQFGMKTIGVRRKPGRDGVSASFDEVYSFEGLGEALKGADYVVSSLPLTPRTNRMLDSSFFAMMEPSTLFVNVGRGKTVDEAALIQAVKDGGIRGAALDVFEREPLPADSPLWDLPNVLVSPHMGADTPMYMERMTDIVCDNLRRYAEGRELRNIVDPVERY